MVCPGKREIGRGERRYLALCVLSETREGNRSPFAGSCEWRVKAEEKGRLNQTNETCISLINDDRFPQPVCPVGGLCAPSSLGLLFASHTSVSIAATKLQFRQQLRHWRLNLATRAQRPVSITATKLQFRQQLRHWRLNLATRAQRPVSQQRLLHVPTTVEALEVKSRHQSTAACQSTAAAARADCCSDRRQQGPKELRQPSRCSPHLQSYATQCSPQFVRAK